jgi:two-component system sensor histidine kinase/response regulator
MLLESEKSEKPFDIALLDFQMPLMDGIMLTRSMRAHAQFQRLPIILLTSSLDREQGRIAGQLDIHATILKPIRREALLVAIAGAIDSFAARAPEPSVTASVQTLSPAAFRGHILLAEDNPVNQKVCGLILKKAGYTFETAANGREALVLLDGGDFDAILLDCQMPEMDGFEAAREIRNRNYPGRRIPIIALTASAVTGERERCLDAGMDDYISKPVRPEILTARLQEWIER